MACRLVTFGVNLGWPKNMERTTERTQAKSAVEATYPGMGLPFNQPETELERETVYETSLGAGVYRSAAGSFL